MNKPVWTLAVGVVLGFLLFLLYDVMKNDDGDGKLFNLKADTLSVSKGHADVEAINERLSSLEDSVSFMSQTLENLSIKLSAPSTPVDDGDGSRRPAPTAVEGREPIPVKTAKRDEPEEGNKNWMDFVDDELAKALVEYGLTPYDYGVASRLRVAAEKLREAEKTLKEDTEKLRERYGELSYSSNDDPVYVDYLIIKAKMEETKKKVVESFRTELSGL